jgi:hypothetical protein
VEVLWRLRISRTAFSIVSSSWETLVELATVVLCLVLVVVTIFVAAGWLPTGENSAFETLLLLMLAAAQGWRIVLSLRLSVADERERSRMVFDSRRAPGGSESEAAELRAEAQLR